MTNWDVPGYVVVIMGAGILPFTNTITVNGQRAYGKGEYFRVQIPGEKSETLFPVGKSIQKGKSAEIFHKGPTTQKQLIASPVLAKFLAVPKAA